MKVVGFLLLIITLASCKLKKVENPIDAKTKHNNEVIDSIKAQIKTGDLLLRRGDDFISDILADLSPTDKTFSHSGVAYQHTDGKMYIISINPESTTNAKDDTVKMEPIDSFVNPSINKMVGLYRIDFSDDEKTKFITELFNYQKAKVRFDIKFNWQDDDKIYCSELIGKALAKATPTKKYTLSTIEDTRIIGVKRFFKIGNEKINLKKYPILPLDQLYLNSFTKPIFVARLKTKRSLN